MGDQWPKDDEISAMTRSAKANIVRIIGKEKTPPGEPGGAKKLQVKTGWSGGLRGMCSSMESIEGGAQFLGNIKKMPGHPR